MECLRRRQAEGRGGEGGEEDGESEKQNLHQMLYTSKYAHEFMYNCTLKFSWQDLLSLRKHKNEAKAKDKRT